MSADALEWIFLLLSPLLGAVVACLFFSSSVRSWRVIIPWSEDHWHNQDYLCWCDWIKMQGDLKPLHRARLFGVEDPCYTIEQGVTLYEPKVPSLQGGAAGAPLFDTPRGTPVGEGWSLADALRGDRLVGKGTLFVTSREIIFRGGRVDARIPLQKIHSVVTACSGILLGMGPTENAYLLTGLNGQKLRDIVADLLEE